MGTVQNAMNQLLATTAAAAVAGTHLSEQRKARELTSVYNYEMAGAKRENTEAEIESATKENKIENEQFATKEAQQKEADDFLQKWNIKHPGQKLAFSRFGSGESIVKSREGLEVERDRIDLQNKAFKQRLEDLKAKEKEQYLTHKYTWDMLPDNAKDKLPKPKEPKEVNK